MDNIPNERHRLLKEDTDVELSCGSFEDLRDIIAKLVGDRRQQIVYRVENAQIFPELITIAEIADETYEDLDIKFNRRHNDWKLLKTAKSAGRYEEWKLLTTARNRRWFNGYFGAMFINSNDFHVVIAHRGTKPTTIGALRTDLLGVWNNSFCSQMESACTFVSKVATVLQRIEDNNRNIRFQMFLTGHSLGGWLAQVTAFAAEYLKIEDGHFVRDDAGKRHPHTVAFDSPGCKPMLLLMKERFGARYEYHDCSLKDLDITTYFWYPNIVNATNIHVGEMYMIEPKELSNEEISIRRSIRYTFRTHQLEKIIAALEGVKYLVKDWPSASLIEIISEAVLPFLNWIPGLRSLVRPHNTCELTAVLKEETGDSAKIHYKTEPVDARKRSLQAFAKDEKLFLETYQLLRKFATQSTPDKFFACLENEEHRTDVHSSLQSFKIDRDRNCCENDNLESFIPYVRQLLRWHPEIYAAAKDQLRDYSIRKDFYDIWHSEFLKELQEFELLFRDADEPPPTPHFTVWQVITKSSTSMHISTMRIYNRVKRDTRGAAYSVLKLKTLLHIEGFASIKDLTNMEIENDHLFIIECNPCSVLHKETGNLLELIVSLVNAQPHVKFIFVTKTGDKLLAPIVEDKCSSLAHKFCQTECGLKWEDLKDESQRKLLEKKSIRLGQKLISLDDFMSMSPGEWGECMNSDLIRKLANGEEITLSEDRMSSIPDAVSEIGQEIPESNLQHFFMHCPEESLFVVDSKVDLFERLNIPNEDVNSLENRLISEADLDRKELREKQILWLEVSGDRVVCRQIRNPDFYFPRQLHLFDFKQGMKGILSEKNSTDAFVISNVVEEQFADLVKMPVHHMKECVFFCTAETAESTFNEKCTTGYASVHWMKVDDKDRIFCYRSSGSLKHLHDEPCLKNRINEAIVDEETFLKDDSEYRDRMVIIAGDPGMGKSTSLIKYMENRHVWTIRRDLRGCHEQISKLPQHEIELENVVEFLCRTAGSGLSDKSIFKLLLRKGLACETRIPIHVMFDAFDEIQERVRPGFLKLLRCLKDNSKCNVWVTTRICCREELEDALSTIAVTFTEVDGKWQDAFLRKYFDAHYAFHLAIQGADTNDELPKYVTHVLSQAEKIFKHDKSSITGVPLQLRILAEVCCPITAGPEQRDFNTLADLLRAFVERKYDVYLKKVTRLNNENSELVGEGFVQSAQKTHRALAFGSMFPDEVENYPHSDWKKWLAVGVIKHLGNDSFGFIHQRFAEYFSADLMVHWLKKPHGKNLYGKKPGPAEDFILKKMLTNKDIRLLIDDLLGKCELQTAFSDRVAECFVNNHDGHYNSDRRNVFYIAIEENRKYVFDFLLSCFKNRHEDLARLISSRDINRKTVLYVAAEKLYKSQLKKQETSQFLKQCLDFVKDIDASTQTTLILATCFRTAQDENNKILKTFHKVVKDYPHSENIVTEVEHMWQIMKTFHSSVFKGRIEDARNCLDEAGNRENGQLFRRYLITATNKAKKTALFLAVNAAHTDIIRLLIEEGADINSSCDYPLHTAVMNGSIAVVEQLIEMGANIQAIDKKRTPLDHAVAGGYREIVKMLLDYGAYTEIATAENPFSYLPEEFQMNAKQLDTNPKYYDKNLEYCLFPIQIAETPGEETSDIAACYHMIVEKLKAEPEFGPQHQNTLATQGMLAKEWCQRRNYKQALDVYRNVLNDMPNNLDPSNNDDIQTMVSIAQLLTKLEEYEEALSVYRDIFARRSGVLEPKHQDMFLARFNIAKILSFQGKYDESLEDYRQLGEDLDLCRSKFHESLMTRHNISQVLACMGQFERSLDLFKLNEVKFVKSFGSKHNYTLITQLNIAQVLSNMGKCEAAIPYYDICIESKAKFKPGSDGQTFECIAMREKEKSLLNSSC